jgi:hypothetical protein
MNQSYREELKRRLIQSDAGKVDYRDFEARCVRKFGPAAGIFTRQLVYWVGKERDQEGWIYKTRREMENETGLSRHHQEKARSILVSKGVIKVRKKGVPGRLWYWVDLEALLNVMKTPHSTLNQWARKQEKNAAETTNERDSFSRDSTTDHTEEIDSMARASRNGSTYPASEDGNSVPVSVNHSTDQPITESTSETTAGISTDNYSSENPLFQSAKAHASRGLSPTKGTEIAITPKSSIGPLEISRVYSLLTTPGSAAYRAYVIHREGSLSLQDLASEVCLALTNNRNQIESYVEPLREIVADLAIDDAASD